MTAADANESSAAYRIGSHRDILSTIASHLDRQSQLNCLTASTTFNLATIPHVYHTIDFGYKYIRDLTEREKALQEAEDGRDEGVARDVRRYVNPFIGTDTDDGSPYNKKAALRHVRVFNLFDHETEMCSALRQHLLPLQNLRVLHMAGGGRPRSEDTHPCDVQGCRVINGACLSGTTVVTRDYGWYADGQPPAFARLDKLIIKLRPCQLPKSCYGLPTEGEVDEDGFYYRTGSPFGPLSAAGELDLVFWDEDHRYRIDITYPLKYDPDRQFGRGGRNRPDKDCIYCNQTGCVQDSPDGSTEVPGILKDLGRWTDLRRVRIYNHNRTAVYGQRIYGGRQAIGVDKIEQRMMNGFAEGRRRRMKALALLEGKAEGGTAGIDQKSTKSGQVCEITFHSAQEYYELARFNPTHAIDDREMEYWTLLCNPTEKTKALRKRLRQMVKETGMQVRDMEYLDDRQLESNLEWIPKRIQMHKREEERRLKHGSESGSSSGSEDGN